MTPVERPLSPHLQIYKPQLTSLLSIIHRATGVVLSIGSVFLVWWLVAAATGDDASPRASVLGLVVRAAAALRLDLFAIFHLCNGIRHLVWDMGYGFDLGTAYVSGWTVVAASAALTLIAWVAGFMMWVPR